MAVFTISVECKDMEFWRYNYIVMCSLRRGGEEVDFLKHRSEIAPVGAELRCAPEGYDPERGVVLRSVDAEELTLYIYVIPHTLPIVSRTEDAEPITLALRIDADDRTILKRQVEINPWSGDNIELRLSAEGLL